MLEKVFYTSVLVTDQDKALDFYTNVLGMEKRVENPTPDGPRFLTVGVKGDDFQLVLWPGTPGQAQPAMGRPPASITIETDDIRRTFEELKSRGVEFASDVLEFPGAPSRSSTTPTATGCRYERADSPRRSGIECASDVRLDRHATHMAEVCGPPSGFSVASTAKRRPAMSFAVVPGLCPTSDQPHSRRAHDRRLHLRRLLQPRRLRRRQRQLDRLLGEARPGVARPPPRLVRPRAADGLRGQDASAVRRDAGLEHRGVRSP